MAYGEPEEAFYAIVGKSVLSVGSNSEYVIVEQRDLKSKNLFYYIVDKEIQKNNGVGSNVFSQYAAVTGPYSKIEFNDLRNKQNLPEFTNEF